MTPPPSEVQSLCERLRAQADTLDQSGAMFERECTGDGEYEREAAKMLRDAADLLTRLSEWKESALASLAKWHALGQALDYMEGFAPLLVGDDIPLTLAERVPAEWRRLRAEVERLSRAHQEADTVDVSSQALDAARQRAERAEAQLAGARAEIERLNHLQGVE